VARGNDTPSKAEEVAHNKSMSQAHNAGTSVNPFNQFLFNSIWLWHATSSSHIMHIFEFRVYFFHAFSENLRLVLRSGGGSRVCALKGLDASESFAATIWDKITIRGHKLRATSGVKAFARICKYRGSFMQAFAGITQASKLACLDRIKSSLRISLDGVIFKPFSRSLLRLQ
jgi:hypothetical protein